MTFELGADGSQVFGLIDEIGAALDAKVSSFTDSLASGIADAVSGVDSLGSALDQVTQNFATGLSGALDIISSAEITPPNTQPIEAAVTDAITTAADTPVDVTNVDAGQLTADLDSAIAAADTGVTLTGDATAVTSSISDAEAAADTQVIVTGDATDITTSIDDAVAASDVTDVPITADTSQADAAVSDLGSTADATSGKIEGLTAATGHLGVAQGLAAGSVESLFSGLEKTGGTLGEVGGAIAGVVGAVSGLAEKGLDAVSAQQRFNSTFGEFGDKVRTVNVAGLSGDIETLGLRLGSTKTASDDALASIGNFFNQTGKSGPQVAQLSQETFLLAARAEALKPSMGDVASIAAGLPNKLAAGARAFRTLGLSVSQSEVLQRAYNDTGKTTTATLTPQEKAVAAVEVAYSKLSGTLGSTVQAAYQNVLIQQKSLVATFQDTFEELGKPLALPFLATLQAATPLVQTFGTYIADLGRVALPLLAPLIDAFGRVGQTILTSFQPALGALVPAFSELGQALGGVVVALGPAFGAIGQSMATLAIAASPLIETFANLIEIVTPFISVIVEVAAAITDVLLVPMEAVGGVLHQVSSAFTDVTPAVLRFLGPVGEVADAIGHFTGGIGGAVAGFFGIGSGASASTPKVKSLGDQIRELAAAQQNQTSATQQQAEATVAKDVADQKVSRSTVDLIAHQLGLNSASDDYASVLAHVNGLLAITGSQQTQYTATLVEQQAAEASIFATLLQESSVRQQLSTAITGNAQAVQLLAQAAGAGIKIDPAQFTALAGAMGVSEQSAQAFFDTFKTGIDDVVKRADAGLPKIEDAFKGAVDKAGNVDWGKLRGNLDKTLDDIVHEVQNFKTLVSLGLGGAATFLAQQGPAALGGAVRHIFQDPSGLADLQHDNIMLTAATTATTGAEQYFQSQGVPIANSLNAWRIPLGNAATGAFGAIPGAATAAVGGLGPVIQAGATAAAPQAATAGDTLAHTFAFGLTAGTTVGDAAAGLSREGAARLAQQTGFWGSAGRSTGAAATAGTAGGLAPLPGVAANVGAQGVGALGSAAPGMNAAGLAVGGQGTAGAAAGLGPLGDVIFGAGKAGLDRFLGLANVAYNDGFGIGNSFSAGISDGISSDIGNIRGAAAAVADAAVQAAKQHLKIGSPSAVMRDEVGIPIAQGLALGILDSTAPETAIASKITSLQRAAISAAQSLDVGAISADMQLGPIALASPVVSGTIAKAVSPTVVAGAGTVDQSQTTVEVTVQHQPGADMTEVRKQGETIGNAAADKIDQARRARLSVEPL